MKISIITPIFNSESTIRRTVRSVVDQDYNEIEYIIVDNLSSDKSLEIIRSEWKALLGRELVIISEKDKGISDAFNKGISKATGDIVAILNSDDNYVRSDVLSDVIKVFEDNTISVVHGNMLFVDLLYGTEERRPLLCSLEKAFPYNHPAFFVKKQVYEKFGLFDLNYRYAMDFEWVCRLYTSPSQPSVKLHYLSRPLTAMYAGGASGRMELKSIDEVERALRHHHFWTNKACYFQNMRRMRIRVKPLFKMLHLNIVVTLWRKWKWK